MSVSPGNFINHYYLISCNCTCYLWVIIGVIEILNKVVHTATKTEEKGDEVIVHEQHYDGLWIISPFEESDFWFLKTGAHI